MAVISPAYFLQGGSHSAQVMRMVVSALVGQDVETFVGGVSASGVGHGVVRSGHLAVSEKSGTPNMSVDVAKGYALITGTSSLAQGVYAFGNDAVSNLAIATADATNPRRDLVIAQVRDNAEDAGGLNDARLAVVAGTPAASPADPVVPANSLVLARVAVAAGATSITNANVTALASVARGSSWNQARGVVASGTSSSDVTNVDTTKNVVTATFTAIAGRRYKITGNVYFASPSTTLTGVLSLYRGGSLVTAMSRIRLDSTTIVVGTVMGVALDTPGAGSVTYQLRCSTTTGNATASNSTLPATIIVEDVGPA